MSIQVYKTKQNVAEAAAENVIATLRQTLSNQASAVWVLAGGSTPLEAYNVIAQNYLTAIDWSKIIFVIGDERIGPLDGPDNNWQEIYNAFLRFIPQATFIRPTSDMPVNDAALDYARQIDQLEKTSDSYPQLDVVWLGMGEDGHTLSLFPGHPDFKSDDNKLVIPVYNSPKPPAERISLTLHGLKGAQAVTILVTGEGKQPALRQVFADENNLPISQAASICPDTLWLLDEAAKP